MSIILDKDFCMFSFSLVSILSIMS